MADDARVTGLLEEMLDSGLTPEQVCRDCPELLPAVRERWQQFARIDADFRALFPEPGTAIEAGGPEVPADGLQQGSQPPGTAGEATGLPEIPGYEVQAVLGHGGMGVVYKAWHGRLQRPVALKMLLAGGHAQPEELERFRREAQAVAGLCHANVVQIHEVGDVGGRPYFTMEFVEGGSLAQHIHGVPQPAHQAATLVATLAEAIHAAHQSGIVHRDLKPANILLTADGTSKVTDFGLARRLEGDGGLTLSGVPMGTPSYMAPEQARGERQAIGPATDVYGLGAILYEMLTGRPPFRADTAAATLQQVVKEEPVPPARLHRLVPRDLETICLKCLHKEPGRRYASAGELADDLRRFLNDEPIQARRPGRWERSRRWLRHRPALAVGLVAAVLLTSGLVGGGLWLNRQQAAQARGVEEDLEEATLQQKKFAWAEAAAALERARGRLGAAGPAELHRRVEQAAHRLGQARRDVSLAARLEAIRLKRATHVEGYFNSASERRFTNARADRDYEEAFRQAGFEEAGTDPAAAATHVRESVVPEALLAALAALARATSVTEQATPLLLALAERLQATGGDAVALVRQVRREHPDDFWVNFGSGKVLREEGKPEEAVACYRKAWQIRPETAVLNNLGLALYDAHVRAGDGNWDEAISCYQKVLDQDRRSAPAHNNLGVVLKVQGGWGKAEEHFRLALQLDPESTPAYCNLGVIKASGGGLNEAIGHFRQALRLDPRCALAHYHWGVVLLNKDHLDTANDNHQRALRDDPKNKTTYDAIFPWAYRHVLDRYYWAVRFDPQWALTPSGLGLCLPDQRRLAEALEHYDQALASDPQLALAEGARGQALLAQGRFTEALTATRRCLDLLARDCCRIEPSANAADVPRNLSAQLRRCEHLLALERRLPAILRQEEKPPARECLAFALLCTRKGRYAAAAGLYADAFTATPHLAENLDAGDRYKAACAAALAGFGHGADATSLSEAERARWRRQARTWLRADVDAWVRKLDSSVPADRDLVRRVSARWWTDPGLVWLRDAGDAAGLSPAERQECLVLWQDAGAVLRRAQTIR